MRYRLAYRYVREGVWLYRPRDAGLAAKFGWPGRPCFCRVLDSPRELMDLWRARLVEGVPLSAPLWARISAHGLLTVECLDDQDELKPYRVPASWVSCLHGPVPWVIECPRTRLAFALPRLRAWLRSRLSRLAKVSAKRIGKGVVE